MIHLRQPVFTWGVNMLKPSNESLANITATGEPIPLGGVGLSCEHGH